MLPSTARDQYVVGRLGSYLAVTVDDVDRHLRALRLRLPGACGQPLQRLLHDIDALLDRRRELQREV